jgi:thiamine transport system substrate-binding protein
VLTTVAYFGETGSYTWKDFWRDLRKNEVLVSKGWSEAYYESFSGAGGAGTGGYPMVVSYATSPAAEVFYSEGALKTPPTGNILPPKGAFRQIEFAGVLKGAKNPELARKWIAFMLSDAAQGDVFGSMAVYPVIPGIKGPDDFDKFAPVPTSPAELAPAEIAKNRERWIREWTEIVLR